MWLFGAPLFQIAVGYLVVGARPNYLVPFICASLAYLIALSVIQLLAPRLAPAIVDEAEPGIESVVYVVESHPSPPLPSRG